MASPAASPRGWASRSREGYRSSEARIAQILEEVAAPGGRSQQWRPRGGELWPAHTTHTSLAPLPLLRPPPSDALRECRYLGGESIQPKLATVVPGASAGMDTLTQWQARTHGGGGTGVGALMWGCAHWTGCAAAGEAVQRGAVGGHKLTQRRGIQARGGSRHP